MRSVIYTDQHGQVFSARGGSMFPDSTPNRLRLALITPARNEEALIDGALRSVVAQTVRPVHWLIVSDGSTDRTDAIVQEYVARHDWIELMRLPVHGARHFGAKAQAFNAGYARLAQTPFDVVGNLDADITFEADYFEFLLDRFARQPQLGVAGTPFVEDERQPTDHTYGHAYANLEHVSGACQLFRRACFEAVGGYVPVPGGAVDWIAVTTARMKGWETRTFLEKTCRHHRKLGTGTGTQGPLRTRFHYGLKAYYVGGHPCWELLRGVFQMRKPPFLLGGGSFLAGYVWAFLRRVERPVSAELMAFHRAEQMARLRRNLGFGRRERPADLREHGDGPCGSR